MAALINAKLETFVLPYPREHCERWVFEFERQLRAIGQGGGSCVWEANITRFTFTGPDPDWEAHAAYRIVFCDGTVVYVDNGGFGGIFYSEDIPGNAEEDFPPDAPPGVR